MIIVGLGFTTLDPKHLQHICVLQSAMWHNSDDFISINDAPPGDAIIITINLYLCSSLQNIVTKCFIEHNKKITFKKS